MDVVALCARSYRFSTLLASGVWPTVSPPASLETVSPAFLERGHLLYLCVHGQEGDPYLYGDNWTPVLSLDTVKAARLPGSLVYVAGCWGAPTWAEAFLAGGAAAVVADRNVAWAGTVLPLGSQALGRSWVRWLRRGDTVGAAFRLALAGYATRHTTARDLEMLDSVALYGDPLAQLAR